MKTSLIAGNSYKNIRQSAAKLEIGGIYMPRFNEIIPIDILNEELIKQRWIYVSDICPEIFDYYMISEFGLLWNRRERRLMSQFHATNSYLSSNLSGINGPKTTMIHRLVALAFVPNPDPINKIYVNHIDGDKWNNKYYNLEWVTAQENTRHAIANGLMNPKLTAKTTLEQRNEIRLLLNEKKYSCREISEMTGVSKSVVSHIRYDESWVDEDNNLIAYTTRNKLSNNDVSNLCAYFQNFNQEYSPEYMREALNACGLGTDANWINMARNIYIHKNYRRISSNYNF